MPSAPATTTTATTEVSVGASFIVNGQKIQVTSQDITKIKDEGFKFSLSAPITFGTPPDLLNWINTQFSASIDTSAIEAAIKEIPFKAISDTLQSFWSMSLIVEVLNIDTGTGLFEIAILLQTPADNPPPPIFEVLTIDSLGFGVTRIGAPDTGTTT
jgi:hypothetical protein